MDTTDAGLFDRIREKCQRDGWYGGHLNAPRWLHVRPDDPQRAGFAYPPASEEQLAATEAVLGFPLPPSLHALYAEIANGGFGPGAGILGALGGYGSHTDEPSGTILEEYDWHRQVGYARPVQEGRELARLVDLADYQWKREKSEEYLLLPCAVWPEQLLSLEDMGCCQEACLDCKTGRVLCTAPTENDEDYILWLLSPSLEGWLERWLRGEVLP